MATGADERVEIDCFGAYGGERCSRQIFAGQLPLLEADTGG